MDSVNEANITAGAEWVSEGKIRSADECLLLGTDPKHGTAPEAHPASMSKHIHSLCPATTGMKTLKKYEKILKSTT